MYNTFMYVFRKFVYLINFFLILNLLIKGFFLNFIVPIVAFACYIEKKRYFSDNWQTRIILRYSYKNLYTLIH